MVAHNIRQGSARPDAQLLPFDLPQAEFRAAARAESSPADGLSNCRLIRPARRISRA
ncbi:MAG TPA: hypothetical protein VGM10_30660 [Actinocrinis sp.]